MGELLQCGRARKQEWVAAVVQGLGQQRVEVLPVTLTEKEKASSVDNWSTCKLKDQCTRLFNELGVAQPLFEAQFQDIKNKSKQVYVGFYNMLQEYLDSVCGE